MLVRQALPARMGCTQPSSPSAASFVAPPPRSTLVPLVFSACAASPHSVFVFCVACGHALLVYRLGFSCLLFLLFLILFFACSVCDFCVFGAGVRAFFQLVVCVFLCLLLVLCLLGVVWQR